MHQDQQEYLTNFLESFLEASQDAAGCFDQNYCYIAFNKKLIQLIQQSFGKTLRKGMSLEVLLKDFPEDLLTMKNMWQRTLEGDHFAFESSYGMTKKTLRSTYTPIKINGNIVGGTLFAKDIQSYDQTRRDMARQEQILKTFFNESRQVMGIIKIIDHDLIHLSGNPAAASFFGSPPEYLKNRKSSELGIPAQDINHWIKYFTEAKLSGKIVKFEYQRDGQFFRVIVSYLGEEEGGAIFSYLMEDLTVATLHEKALIKNQDQLSDDLRLKGTENILAMAELGKQKSIFETIMQTSTDIIYVKDKNGRIIYLNEALSELVGRPKNEIIGLNDVEFLGVGNGGEEIIKNDQRIILKGKPENIEERIFDKIYLSSKAPFKDSHGQIVGILGISKEITTLKETELQLREALETNKKLIKTIEYEKDQNEAILNQMPVGITVAKAPDGKIIYTNKKIDERWGSPLIPTSSIDEYNKWKFFHLDGTLFQPEEWPLARTIKTGEIVSDEDVEVFRQGQKTVLRLNSCPILSEHGDIIAGVLICQDITELTKAIRARDEFLSIASHELKTPLTSLKLQAQIMKRDLEKNPIKQPSPDRISKLVDQLDRQTTRLNKIVDDMLDVSKVRMGKLKLRLRQVDLCQLTQEVLARMKLQQDEIEFNFKNCQDVEGEWDADRMEQVLINLISNSIKYGKGRPVEVAVFKEGESAIIEVKDQGMGIEKKMIPIIFEKFERGGISSKDISGLGIGLFITKQIVLAHGGEISVSSELHQGSTFKIRLPLRGGQAEFSVTDH